MPFGQYKGKTLERKSDRPVINLKNDTLSEKSFSGEIADAIDEKANKVLIANIFHRPNFYIAKIDLDKVKNVYFLFEKFIPGAAHTMVRFEFSDESPIELIAQLPDKETWDKGIKFINLEKPLLVSDLVLSIDAEWTVGNGGFNPLKGVLGEYTSIFRFFTVESFAETYFASRPFPVEQFRLNLNNNEAKGFLMEAFNKSAKYGVGNGFNTICNNCTNNPVKMLESSVPYGRDNRGVAIDFLRRNLDKLLLKLPEVHPNLLPITLLTRGWRDVGSKVENLEQDKKLKSLFIKNYKKMYTRLNKPSLAKNPKYGKILKNLQSYKVNKCLVEYY